MLDSVIKTLRKTSEYAQGNLKVDEEIKSRYENDAIKNGVDLFKSLLSELVDEFLKRGEAVCCYKNFKGIFSGDDIELKVSKQLDNPAKECNSANFYHIAVRINEDISNSDRMIYAYRKDKNSSSKPVKLDLDSINKEGIINITIFYGHITMWTTLTKFRELCSMAVSGILHGPYYDEDTINMLKNAYNEVSEKEKALNLFILRMQNNAATIYKNIYERLVNEYLEASYKTEYVISVDKKDVEDYDDDPDLKLNNDTRKMVELFNSSAYGYKGDKILFLALVFKNGKKRFLPVQQRFFRSLFTYDGTYGFDFENSTIMNDTSWVNSLDFKFIRTKFEKKVAGLRRVKEPKK